MQGAAPGWAWGLALAVPLALAGAGEPAPPTGPTNGPARARIIIAEEPGATENFVPNPERVQALLHRALTNFTKLPSVPLSWRSLVSTQDVVGLKVYAAPGPNVGTRVAVAEAVVRGLLQAGLPGRQIIVWDKQIEDLRQAGFVEMADRLGVRAAGAAQAGWDPAVFYDTSLLGLLVHGDLEFTGKPDNVGRKSFVSKLVTQQMTRIINLSPMLNHNSAGVCGNLYSLAMGSVDNTVRFEHDTFRQSQALPEIYALPALGDRVVLNIVDALIAQYEGELAGRLHYSSALNQLRLSTDPIALDVLSLQELHRLRERAPTPGPLSTNLLEIYHNASLLELGVSDPARLQIERFK
jgi:hypothetical protein